MARLLAAGLVFSVPTVAAQPPSPPGVTAGWTFDAPPPPVPPAVISRDETGRGTLRASRLASPLRIDGRLDEEAYDAIPGVSDFIQIEPQEGSPATQRTEVWVLFDREHVYVSARCWESHPERMVAKEMRRDNNNTTQGEYVGFALDTFYDRRNGVIFTIAPTGGRMDGQVTAEKQYNVDWNPVYDVAVGTFAGGWTVELAVPFKSLRYMPGRTQVWGFQALRNNRWKNEQSFLSPVPAEKGAGLGLMMFSRAATLVGLDVPPPSRNLDIKPYVASSLSTDRLAAPRVANELGGDVGLDVKYAITENLTGDFTYNTDFAQVEADEQQINLTRFNLLFPEKRDFFLENQGLFAFGGAGAAVGASAANADVPLLFYSRRIGLAGGREVPIQGGGRVTGRVGRYSLGALTIQADDEPAVQATATNFSVVRVKRDVLRRSSIGAILTTRSQAERGPGGNAAYGLDGSFAFFDNLSVTTYWARSHTDEQPGDETSYRAQVDYTGDRYGLQLDHVAVGEGFNPEVGFVRRRDMRRSFGQARFSPRPAGSAIVRKYSWVGSFSYVESGGGVLETRESDGEFAVDFQSGDRLIAGVRRSYERLPEPFPIAPGVTLPIGAYEFNGIRAGYALGQQWLLSGTFLVEHGGFFSGDRTAVSFSRGRVNLTPRLSVEPNLSVNRVTVAEGAFTTRLIGSRITFTATPLMFLSALLQYNSTAETTAANVRFRWEYRPGSELFVVYNEQRDTASPRFPFLVNRALILKVNRLFRP